MRKELHEKRCKVKEEKKEKRKGMKYDEEGEGKWRENDDEKRWRLDSNLIYCENP